jgi:hypothetical protein
MMLRILLLTWEYPPRIVGEIAFAVRDLSEGLRKLGVETIVVTLAGSSIGLGLEEDSEDSGKGKEKGKGKGSLQIIRVGNPVGNHIHILTWDMTLMTEFERVSGDVYYRYHGKIDLVDAHEWLCITAALNLQNSLGLPFVFSIHSTELQRSRGAREPLSQSIRSIEAMGLQEASGVIVRSQEKKTHLITEYGVPPEKIYVIDPFRAEEVLRIYSSIATRRMEKPGS